jgi:hypothetical protein
VSISKGRGIEIRFCFPDSLQRPKLPPCGQPVKGNHHEPHGHHQTISQGPEKLARRTPGFPFVTISRQSGAGGHTLAREIIRRQEMRLPAELAEGWELFDQKLCALIAQDEKIGISFDSLVEEEYRSEISQTIHEMIHQKASRYIVYKRMFEVVRLLATLGKCVVVGHGHGRAHSPGGQSGNPDETHDGGDRKG